MANEKSNDASRCPMTSEQVIERYFLEHRAKLLDVAAFLDRIDRASDAPQGRGDYRIEQLNQAVRFLVDGRGERTRRALELFSDPTSTPIDKAPGKGAVGAYDAKANRE